MKYAFAYKNYNIETIFCGKDELFEELKQFLITQCGLIIVEVSKADYVTEQKMNQWNDRYTL
ncbi:hypothetical protein QRX25_13185 [Bacillus sp. L381]|uniref:hypothetical protein n=1 Tax=Bacillus TaxID=1386 RepID=UPI001BA7A415|nr:MULTISPECIES: hypothetical protein [Bacillus]MCR9039071.1 hypothetical protein [Bacillus velezensis]QUN08476.1 hypothetical protein KEF49_13015 [Bacillus amyloliquefaciens]QYM81547.1 hypothetical protein KTJ85_12865 [Bacillus sp. 7D3]QZY10694.1 hypothetical protein K7B13_13105 [Bacillus amyloliquefaciens]WIX20594.1 hypothetical protein QRX25_13185 [Bacillus sp. L381]